VPVCDCGVTLRDLAEATKSRIRARVKLLNFQFLPSQADFHSSRLSPFIKSAPERKDSSTQRLAKIAFKYQGHEINKAPSLMVMNDSGRLCGARSLAFFCKENRSKRQIEINDCASWSN
jgi:hypothetical protein